MWTQRETGRRWPFARKRGRGDESDTVELLDSVSLTASFTDPNPPETAPSTTAWDLLATVSARTAFDYSDVGDAQSVDRGAEPRVRSRQDRGHAGGEPLRRWERVPLRTLAIGGGCVALVLGALAAGLTMGTATNPPAHVHVAASPAADRLALSQRALHFPRATSVPDSAPPQVADSAPTSAHEVFGYAPYWSLPQASQFPVDDFTTIAYFGVDVNPDGTIEKSGPGWAGYESQDFTDLVNAAHQTGDRVVLTVTDFSNSSLDTLTHNPKAGVTLGLALRNLLQEKNLDGATLDFEGTGNGDQAGLDKLVSQVDFILHTTDPHYQLTMATYANSAGDPSGFFDIPTLSKWVNAFFVMAYDVNQGSAQGNGNAGSDDASYISQYTATAGASKVILGLPLFGYDEPTSGPDLGDAATGPSQAVTYEQAMASGPTYWDAATQTAWTSYQTGGQWHQVFFDNVNTIADKVQLAASSHLLGVGAWALGMEGTDDSVLSTLNGGITPQRTPPAGPAGDVGSSQAPAFQVTGNSGAPPTAGASSVHTRKAGAAGAITSTTTTVTPQGSKGSTTSSAPSTSTTIGRPPSTTTPTTGGAGTTGASSTTTTGPSQ